MTEIEFLRRLATWLELASEQATSDGVPLEVANRVVGMIYGGIGLCGERLVALGAEPTMDRELWEKLVPTPEQTDPEANPSSYPPA